MDWEGKGHNPNHLAQFSPALPQNGTARTRLLKALEIVWIANVVKLPFRHVFLARRFDHGDEASEAD